MTFAGAGPLKYVRTNVYIYWIMISLHTWVDRMISNNCDCWRCNTKMALWKQNCCWFDLVWFEPSHPNEGRDRVCLPEPVVFQTEGDITLSWSGLSWFDLVWVEPNHPPLLSRDMIGCVFPSRLCFKPRETSLWVDLVWVDLIWFELNWITPHYYRGTWSGLL
jgi:hypothetical protein